MDSQAIKIIQEFDSHLKKRNEIKQMLRDKNVSMLDSSDQTISHMVEQNLQPAQIQSYQAMKQELQAKGFDEFRFLGQGAQGVVFLAKEQLTNRRYAIKGIFIKDLYGNVDPIIQKQVEQEVKLLKACKGSPYVLNLIDQIDGNQFTFLVFSECKGTLSQIVSQYPNRKLNELSSIKYAKDIAEGLYYIHSQKCLVKDIKIDSILIDYNGNAVIADFGFADCLSRFGMNEYKGNEFYKAPECCKPQDFAYFQEYSKKGINISNKPTIASEACSLGYMIYSMISGFKIQLMFNKHMPLDYDNDFSAFAYEKQLRYIIDGLTKFNPSERLSIKEVLIILKGIVSFEFNLDDKFVELMNADIQDVLSQSFNQQIQFVQSFKNQCYPIIQDEKSMVQQIQIIMQQGQASNSNQINLLNQTIIQQKQQIQSLDGQVKQLNQGLSKGYNENQQIASYSNQINQLSQALIQQEQQIQSLNGQVSYLNQELSKKQNENQQLNQNNISLKEKISQLEVKLKEAVQMQLQNYSQQSLAQQAQMNINQQIQYAQLEQVINALKTRQEEHRHKWKSTFTEKCATGGNKCQVCNLDDYSNNIIEYQDYCETCDACRACKKKFH